jgi:hypothetical protein
LKRSTSGGQGRTLAVVDGQETERRAVSGSAAALPQTSTDQRCKCVSEQARKALEALDDGDVEGATTILRQLVRTP